MRTHDQKSRGLLNPLLLAGAVALASFLGAADLARVVVANIGPSVGDVLAFRAHDAVGPDMDARLEVDRAGHGTCRLEVAVLRDTGGSLVVEQRQLGLPGTFQVHWSGPQTSRDGQDCGTSADLRLKTGDMDVLAMAAGGYGVARHSLLPTGPWGSPSPPVR